MHLVHILEEKTVIARLISEGHAIYGETQREWGLSVHVCSGMHIFKKHVC